MDFKDFGLTLGGLGGSSGFPHPSIGCPRTSPGNALTMLDSPDDALTMLLGDAHARLRAQMVAGKGCV